MVDGEQFRLGMALLAGGVTIVSTGTGAMRRGLTATAVCSLSADPPSLIACVNQATGTAKAMRDNQVFAVSLLDEAQKDLAMVYAGATGVVGAERFEHGDWEQHPTGVPTLRDSLASFVCRIDSCVPHGSHYVFVGLVEEVVLGKMNSNRPVVWLGSSFHSLVPSP